MLGEDAGLVCPAVLRLDEIPGGQLSNLRQQAIALGLGDRFEEIENAYAGADRVLTMTLHSPQVQAFFRVPVDQLHALNELAEHFRQDDLSNTIVVSPDLGNAKTATTFSRMLGTPVAAGAKQRFENDQVRITSMIGDVKGKDVIVLDDEIANGSTILEVLRLLADEGVGSVKVACTHGILSNGAVQRIAAIPAVTEIVCTNTVPIADEKRDPKLTVLTVAPAFAKAIHHIHTGESVSALFNAP